MKEKFRLSTRARCGKIARLPEEIRQEVNRRILDGQLSPEILPWLNAHPVVIERMATYFSGRPIDTSSLSQWRLRGYQEWLRMRNNALAANG